MTGHRDVTRRIAAAPKPRRQPVVVNSRYRCRFHTDEPVSRTGAGCPECERPKRRRPEPRDEFEWLGQ